MSKGIKSIGKKVKSAFAFDFSPDAPKIDLPAPPPEIDLEGAHAAESEKKLRRRAKGRASTILTGSQGDTSIANIGTKKLLGQ